MMNTSTVTAIPRFEIKINPQTDSIKWGDVVWVDFGNEAMRDYKQEKGDFISSDTYKK